MHCQTCQTTTQHEHDPSTEPRCTVCHKLNWEALAIASREAQQSKIDQKSARNRGNH
jgi:hypothetical protein